MASVRFGLSPVTFGSSSVRFLRGPMFIYAATQHLAVLLTAGGHGLSPMLFYRSSRDWFYLGCIAGVGLEFKSSRILVAYEQNYKPAIYCLYPWQVIGFMGGLLYYIIEGRSHLGHFGSRWV